MNKMLWQPSTERIKSANITQFTHRICDRYGCKIESYSDLHLWSIQNPNLFWDMVWQETRIYAENKGDIVLSSGKRMIDTQWFPKAKLNYAQNLLIRKDEKMAICYYDELGRKKYMSYGELYSQVAQLSTAMRKSGVNKGDVIAGILPNCPEAIIAALATVACGAIWTCCSPDFGVNTIADRFQQTLPKIIFCVDGYSYNGKFHSQIDKINKLRDLITSLELCIGVFFLPNEERVKLPKWVVPWHEFINQDYQEIIPFESVDFNHPLFILYSSGTTGKPKCIVHSHGGVLLQHRKEHYLHCDLKEDDILFYFTTCGWMMWNWQLSGLASGATLLLYEGSPNYPHNQHLWEIADKENITIFGVSASYLSMQQKNALKPSNNYALNSLKTILSTGSPLSAETFLWVYKDVKNDVCLSSISGGTDIISCFALGNVTLPVYAGEIQCLGLGMNVAIYNHQGQRILNNHQKGELVCLSPFPSMPVYFWNDMDKKKYYQSYFSQFNNIWAHGDYAELTSHHGMIIHGRSDAVLNPGGVRIGTAEIYRLIEQYEGITECLVVGQQWQGTERIILFVVMKENYQLNDDVRMELRQQLREKASPRHVPAKILAVKGIPKTPNGKLMEVAVKRLIHGEPFDNKDVISNPEVLKDFEGREELKD